MRIGANQRVKRTIERKACGLALALLVALPLVALPGTSALAQRANEPPVPKPIDPFMPGVVIDYREHMRAFVQSISTFAKSINPKFVIIAKDGLALVGKPDPEDDTKIFPANAYMRSIDGVMETGLLNQIITTPQGKADPQLEAQVKRKNEDLAMAHTAGLTVFGLEYATEPSAVDATYAALAKKGLIPFVAEAPQLASLPKHPATAFSANPLPITSTKEARNFLYVANAQTFGTSADFGQALRTTNHDIVIVDVFHNRKPLTRDDIYFMKYKNLGSPRLVLAQLDIAHATPFQYYWQPGWGPGSPPFLFSPVREDPDSLHTIYWDAGWQAIISGNANSYLYGIVDLGFDGVVLKGVDAWRFYEAGGDTE
ncbi:MAG: hypothetical protein NUV50_00965 [Rhodospirillales bacterium]|nr:hypothetical protein [Rhodospirillales bacterium]